MAEKSSSPARRIFDRYFVNAMGSMTHGLFATLIVGTILGQISGLFGIGFLTPIADVLKSPQVFGAAIGAAIALGLKAHPLVIFSCAGAGAIGCAAGGPVGAYVAGVVGAELGQLVSKRTPVDIVVTPIVAVVAGGLAGRFVGPYVDSAMEWLRVNIDAAMALMPLLMGIVIGTVVGMVLTSPISSLALCVMVGIDGLAAGAAVAGCCAQMIGFAVISFGDNGVSGLLSQGIGTSMLQLPNIMRRPQIWIAPTIASAVCGALSAVVFGMQTDAVGAGMGTSGLVGQITTFSIMSPAEGTIATLVAIALVHFIAPGLIALVVDRLARKLGWVRKGDMTLHKI